MKIRVLKRKKVLYANKFERCWVKQNENYFFVAGFLGASSAQCESLGEDRDKEGCSISPGTSLGNLG